MVPQLSGVSHSKYTVQHCLTQTNEHKQIGEGGDDGEAHYCPPVDAVAEVESFICTYSVAYAVATGNGGQNNPS